MALTKPRTVWTTFKLKTAQAVSRALYDRMIEGGLSVKDFGAKGDGVTKDTVAVQAAITTGYTMSIPVFFPAGNYLVDTLYYYTKSVLYGVSQHLSTLVCPDSLVTLQPDKFSEDVNTTRFHISKLGFNGKWHPNKNTSAESALFIKGYDYKVEDVLISEYGGVAVFATAHNPHGQPQATEHIESYFSRIKITKCYKGGINYNSPSDSFLKDVIVVALGDDAAGWGWAEYSPENFGIMTSGEAGAVIVEDCHVYGYFQHCYRLNAGSTRLYDCIGEGATSAQVHIGAAGAKLSRGRYFNGYNADGTSWRANNVGISIADGITDCTIETDIVGCPQGGVVFLGQSGGHNIVRCSIYAKKATGALEEPKAFVGGIGATDVVENTYVGSAAVIVPYGVDITQLENYTNVLAQGSISVTDLSIVHGKNLFSVTKTTTGVFKVNLTHPCESNKYVVDVTPTSDVRLFVSGKEPNGFTVQCKNPYDNSLTDTATFDVVIHGARR